MFVSIIGILKDNENKTCGYRLLDIDDNNRVIDVTPIQLINVLKQKKMKIHNAKLVGNKIVGIYYSINDLPIIYNNRCESTKLVLLLNIDNSTNIVSDCNGNVQKISQTFIHSYYTLINKTHDGRLLCPHKTTKVSEHENIISKLDREAANPDVLWDLKTFDKYMRLNGYTYKLMYNRTQLCVDINDVIEGEDIQIFEVSPNCRILHLPVEVTSSENLFNTGVKYVDTIIFGPKFRKISNFEKYSTAALDIQYRVNNIYFQHKNKIGILDLAGLRCIDVANKLNLPNCERISYAFDYCILPSVVLNVVEVYHSFRNIQLPKDTTIVLNNVKYCVNSFTNVSNNGKIVVDIGGRISTIRRSFASLNIDELVFRQGTEILSIDSSFKNIGKLKKVDLRNCSLIDNITEKSFSNMKLDEFILNNKIHLLGKKVGEDAGIKSVRIPKSVSNLCYPLFDETTNIILEHEEIHKDLFYEYEYGTISMPNAKILKKRVGESSKIFDIMLSQSLEILEEESLYRTHYTIFDTRDFPNVKELPKKCLAHCDELKTIIIGDNISTVGSNIAAYSKNIDAIIIGKNVAKIDIKAFNNIKNQGLYPTFYVFKDSTAHKLCDKLGYPYVIITDMDAYNNNVNETPENKLNKFRMLLSGTEYEILLKDKYINNITFLYKLITKVKANEYVDYGIKLNTSKFKKMSLDRVPNLKKDIESIDYILNSEINRFESICNMITSVFDNCNELYTDEFTQTIDKFTCKMYLKYYYNEYIILLGYYTIYNNINYNILYIIIDGDIVFQTPIDINSASSIDDTFNNLIVTYREYENNVDIINYMMPGDSWTDERLIMGGVEIPDKFKILIVKAFKDTLLYIGTIAAVNNNSMGRVLYFDMITIKFIELSAIFELSSYTKEGNTIYRHENLSSFKVIKIADNISDFDNRYLNEMRAVYADKIINNMTKLIKTSADEINSLFSNIDYYDINSSVDICIAADEVYSQNIRDINSANREVIRFILKSGLLSPINLSLNACNKKYSTKRLYQMQGTTDVIIEYTTGEDTKISSNSYISGLISMDTSMGSTKVMYISEKPLNDIIGTLYTLGYCRASNSYKPLNRIVNERVNPDNFIFYAPYSITTGKKFHLAFDRANGDAYIIADIWDSDFYTLFRFKNARYAREFMLNITYNRRRRYSIQIMENIINSSTDINTGNNLFRDRNLVLDGFNDKYPYIWDSIEFFETLAKQPK